MNVKSRPFRKPFSQDLYRRKYDNPAKNALINLLLSEGHGILDLNESFYADIISEKDGIQYYSEGEVKTRMAWSMAFELEGNQDSRAEEEVNSKAWSFNFLHFFLELLRCWKIDSSLLTDDILREAIGRGTFTRVSYFYHIPYQDAELIDLKSLAA